MLTDEDKKWLAGELSRQSAASEERLAKLIDARIAASEDRMTERMIERIEKVETALLTEFHKWASPVVTRLRSQTEALRTLDLELEALQARVEKLENRTPGA